MLSIMKNKKTSLQRLFPVYFHVSPLGDKNITVKGNVTSKNGWTAGYRCLCC